MDSGDEDGRIEDGERMAARKPWVEPRVILSKSMSRARVDNKGMSNIPDNRASHLSSTSTS